MRRLAFAFLIALAVALFARPLLHGEVFTFRDHLDYFQPLRWFTATAIRAGHLPLWNPYNESGEPWLANPQTGVFYPPAWLFLIMPFATAYMLYLLGHLALLGCGAFLLFSRRATAGAALIGATALMFSGPTLSLVDVQNNLTTFAWLPLVVWCGLARVPKMWSAAAIAMSFLAGEPFFAATGALIFAVVRRGELFDVAAQSFSLAGIQLVPFLAMLQGSDRTSSSIPAAQLLRDSMPPLDWVRVMVPPSLTAGGFDPRLGQHFIPLIYCGLFTCALAALGALVAWRRAAGWLALLVGTVLLSAGSYLPPVGALLAHLPLTLFRYPARVVPLAALAIAALAVQGWDGLTRLVRIRSLAVLVALATCIELTSVAQPLLRTAPFNPHIVPYDRAVGRDAKIVRNALPQLVAQDRTAWISGYLNLYDRRFDVWTAAPLSTQRYTALYDRAMTESGMDLLDAMSAGYVLSARPLGLPIVARARRVTVYRNGAAMPLAYAREASGRMVAPSLLIFGTTFVQTAADVASPSMIVITQQRAPGWSVEVDGRGAEPEKTVPWLAVRIPPGHHEVLWRYRSVPLLAGALLTFLAVVRMLLPKSFVKR